MNKELNEQNAKLGDERDRKSYQWYVDYIFKNGKSPTLQEFADYLGGVTRVRAKQVAERMLKKGYLLKVGAFGTRRRFYPIPDILENIIKK